MIGCEKPEAADRVLRVLVELTDFHDELILGGESQIVDDLKLHFRGSAPSGVN